MLRENWGKRAGHCGGKNSKPLIQNIIKYTKKYSSKWNKSPFV
jgi:hypothetical protein